MAQTDTLCFEFRLRPLADVRGVSDPPYLSWFWLTEGWFWIQAGNVKLFRYTDAALRYWETEYPLARPTPLPYEDYPVVRYWEDLLQMLPAVLDPVPDDLCERIADPALWEAWQEKVDWWQDAYEDDPDDGEEKAWEIKDAALRWWWDRSWGAAHLARPPRVWLWTQNETVHVRWNNRDILVNHLPVWEADEGEITLPKKEFVAAVQSFNDRFIAAMHERVQEIQAAWSHPDVFVDVPVLVREHKIRADTLDFARIPAPDYEEEWETVRDALVVLDDESCPPAPQ